MTGHALNETTGLVTFQIKVDGKTIENEIQSITTYQEVNKIPGAKIVLSDGNYGDFELSEDSQYKSGKSVEIKVGYHQAEHLIFEGEILRQSIRYKNSSLASFSGAQLVLECKHSLIHSTTIRKNIVHKEVSSRTLLSDILSNYNVNDTIASEGFPAADYTQFEQSDWSFITNHCKQLGWGISINDDQVIIGALQLASTPVTTLHYGNTIIDLEAELDAGTQVGEVSMSAWDSQTLKQAEVTTSIKNEEYAGKQALRVTGEVTEFAMKKMVDGFQHRKVLAEKRGRVKCSGIGSLKVGDTIQLKGLGKFEGNVLVSGILHHCVSGQWHTDIQFGLTLDDEENYRNSEGQKKSLEGLFIGTVRKIIEDPNQSERVLVHIPVFDKSEAIWARLSTPDAGEERGWNFWPEVNDEVIVGFLQNDPNQAIVLGNLHGKKNKSPFPPTEGNPIKGYKSRSGLELSFNDEEAAISIQTKQGSALKLSDSDKGILLSDEHNNALILHEKGITITSQGDLLLKSKGDVKLSGNNVAIEAKAQGKVKAASGLEVSSNAITSVKGNPIKLN